jgi:hypothetical protein
MEKKVMVETFKKTTTFTGYCSGDYECFCLSDIPFPKNVQNKKAKNLYPNDFFPEECTDIMHDDKKKFKFTITVVAEEVKE